MDNKNIIILIIIIVLTAGVFIIISHTNTNEVVVVNNGNDIINNTSNTKNINNTTSEPTQVHEKINTETESATNTSNAVYVDGKDISDKAYYVSEDSMHYYHYGQEMESAGHWDEENGCYHD